MIALNVPSDLAWCSHRVPAYLCDANSSKSIRLRSISLRTSSRATAISMSRRAPTPLRSTPSSAPLEAMVAKKQAHIEELVTQTRTLEHTITKLRQTLIDEQTRAKDAVTALQQKWKEERAEWREGCDSLQAAHRIAHLRTSVELDRERLAVLKVREETRMERLARLQRDYRLVAFQRREFELEARIMELEKELEEVRLKQEHERRALDEQLEGRAVELQARCAELAEEQRETAEQLADTLKEKAKIEVCPRPRYHCILHRCEYQALRCLSLLLRRRKICPNCARSTQLLSPHQVPPQPVLSGQPCTLKGSSLPLPSSKPSMLRQNAPSVTSGGSWRNGAPSRIARVPRWRHCGGVGLSSRCE